MNSFKQLKKSLFKCIKSMDHSKALFVENPEIDFTRIRKFTFSEIVKTILCLEAGSLKDELLSANDYSIDTPSVSAFIQSRNKIKVDAFQHLFKTFNRITHEEKLYKGYRLLAVDGSEIPIDSSFKDSDTTLRNCNQTHKSYSAYHLNASYDLMECTYDDVIIQGQAKMNENDAFCNIVDRYKGHKAIFIADRGYESYNGFEHVELSRNYYLVRVKDINSKTSMTKSLGPYPSDEFDIDVSRILTTKQNKEVRNNPALYKFVPNNMRFDFLSKETPFYNFKCRIVRFKISDDSYETIITNLDRDEFNVDEIKKLYNMRWGIETSFRLIKYALDLNAFHSKKRKFIKQEIYARLVIYNLSQRVVQNIEVPKKKTKHAYQINFTRAFHIVREFIRKKTGARTPVEDLIVKELLPVRPGRVDERHVSHKRAVCFNYRYD